MMTKISLPDKFRHKYLVGTNYFDEYTFFFTYILNKLNEYYDI